MTTENFTFMRRSIVFCFIILMAIFIVWTALSEYAAIASLQNRFIMSTWKASRSVTNDAEYNEALTKSYITLILSPYNADYFLDAANLYEWGAMRHPAWTPEAHELRGQAIEYYRDAVTIRPSWGYAWAHLAHSKILDQQFDKETFTAFEKAMVMEPWAEKVQRKVVWSGIVMWDFMPPEQRGLFLKTLKRVLMTRHKTTFLLEMAAYAGWEEHLWPLLETDGQRNYFKNAIKKYNAKRKN